MSGAGHLTRRFFGSLVPAGPRPRDEAWVASVLRPGELTLWHRMSRPDRRHAAAVARRVERSLGPQTEPAYLAAALLHDVGKIDAGLGTGGRVVATLAGMAGRRTLTPRIERYLRHDEIGADLLRAAGSDERTVTWAREHHLPPTQWTLPRHVAEVLKAADDD